MMEDLCGAKAVRSGAKIGAETATGLNNAAMDLLVNLGRIIGEVSRNTEDERVQILVAAALADSGEEIKNHVDYVMEARRDKDRKYIVAATKETTRDFLGSLRFHATLGRVTGTYVKKEPRFSMLGAAVIGFIAATLTWLFFGDFYAAQTTVYGQSAHATVNLLWPKLFLSGLAGLAGFCLGGLVLGWINPREVPVTVSIELEGEVQVDVTEQKGEVA